MKKQLFVLATITAIVFTSCSKEKIETPQTNQPEEIAGARGGGGGIVAPIDLKKGLLGLYEFNGNLIEATGKLMTGSPNGSVFYTNDRKGMRGRAVKFNGSLDISLGNVPHSAKMSVSAWVKYDSANAMASNFITSQSDGPRFMQVFNQYYAYNNPTSNPNVGSGAINNQWHFLVATIDGSTCRFYVDGSLVGSVASPDVENLTTAMYLLGYGNTMETKWHGAIDDLRFYNRTITAAEVQALFNL
jgi:hypothetical protein